MVAKTDRIEKKIDFISESIVDVKVKLAELCNELSHLKEEQETEKEKVQSLQDRMERIWIDVVKVSTVVTVLSGFVYLIIRGGLRI